ncbi:glycosyltransferase family 4 protein [Endozoicomonas elysicola]|uniref:Glycosyl transferase n=1 Tax=Endozoicomonas elysicola TaxID=305900 RepID=A0A081KAG8_9GAMM|nr:glycosyltransferase family 4 protein [Endozoicomonas elysicola]KEI71144.1 glycosyl transferase [Endozoicomonas elysicola]
MKSDKILLYVINVDWYFRLHWLDRAKHFRSSGFKVHILTNFTDSDFKIKLINEGFFCHHFPLKRKSLNLLNEIHSILSIHQTIKKISPSIVHAITIKPNIYVGLIRKITSKFPVIYNITGLGIIFSSKTAIFRLFRKLSILLYRLISTKNSYFIFENSDDLRIFIAEKIINNNGFLIKGAGVDIEKFYPSVPMGRSIVLFAARLLKDKGLNDLIEAREILAADGISFIIRVAGILDGDVHFAISEHQIQYWHNNGKIEWLGQVHDMPSLIESCDIVCLPTTYGEGVPRILIEAAASQRPIVATDIAGCREIVDHGVNGLLCAPSNPQALAKSLRTLLANNLIMKAYGINGRRKVINEFAQEHVFESTQKIYDALLSTHCFF